MRAAPLLLGAGLVLSGCAPWGYVHSRSGRIVDADGRPLPGAYVYTRTYKACGSVGGATNIYLKDKLTRAGADGRYSRTMAGAGFLYFVGIGGCLGFKSEDMACRYGRGCVRIEDDGDVRLANGSKPYMGYPPYPAELRTQIEWGCPLDPERATAELPRWDGEGALAASWYCGADGQPVMRLEGEGVAGWLTHREGAVRWTPGPVFAEEPSPSAAPWSAAAFALREKRGLLLPLGHARWAYRLVDSSGAKRPVVPQAEDLGGAFQDWVTMRSGRAVPSEVQARLPAQLDTSLPPELARSTAPPARYFLHDHLGDYPFSYGLEFVDSEPEELLALAGAALARHGGTLIPRPKNDHLAYLYTYRWERFRVPAARAEAAVESLRELGIFNGYVRRGRTEPEDVGAAMTRAKTGTRDSLGNAIPPKVVRAEIRDAQARAERYRANRGTALMTLTVIKPGEKSPR